MPVNATIAAPGVKPLVEHARTSSGQILLKVSVVAMSSGLFTEHKLANINSSSFFVPTNDLIPLGTRLEVELRFPPETRVIKTRGVVVIETRQEGVLQMKGYGVKLEKLNPDEVAFLRATIDEFRRKRS